MNPVNAIEKPKRHLDNLTLMDRTYSHLSMGFMVLPDVFLRKLCEEPSYPEEIDLNSSGKRFLSESRIVANSSSDMEENTLFFVLFLDISFNPLRQIL